MFLGIVKIAMSTDASLAGLSLQTSHFEVACL